MKYKVGDEVHSYHEYIMHCLTMEEVEEELKPGDKVIMCQSYKIKELIFKRYAHCEYGRCEDCKGAKVFKEFDRLVCGNNGLESNIYKIIKNDVPLFINKDFEL